MYFLWLTRVRMGLTVRKQREGGCKRIAHLVLPRGQAWSHLSHQKLDGAPVGGCRVRKEGLVAHHQREQLIRLLGTLQPTGAALEGLSWGRDAIGHYSLLAAAGLAADFQAHTASSHRPCKSREGSKKSPCFESLTLILVIMWPCL